jgi:5-enolpyruvylshikimate-3-phosphate synthase
MNRVANPLREMGAVIETAAEGRPPMTIRGGHKLKGLTYTMPMASAQVKSCLLLAGLYAEGKTTVTEPARLVIIPSACCAVSVTRSAQWRDGFG